MQNSVETFDLLVDFFNVNTYRKIFYDIKIGNKATFPYVKETEIET